MTHGIIIRNSSGNVVLNMDSTAGRIIDSASVSWSSGSDMSNKTATMPNLLPTDYVILNSCSDFPYIQINISGTNLTFVRAPTPYGGGPLTVTVLGIRTA